MMNDNINNDYYRIAVNDLKYLQYTLASGFYNNIAVGCQQVAEKMLKSVAEVVCTGIGALMNSHNLRALYNEIYLIDNSFRLNKSDLSLLKDYYFDAKYPGTNYVDVDFESCKECLDIMYNVVNEVNKFRKSHGFDVYEYEKIDLTKIGK